MKNITVIIAYEIISPAVLENIFSNGLMCWCGYHEVDEDYFEFWIECREEDAAWVERKLAQYM